MTQEDQSQEEEASKPDITIGEDEDQVAIKSMN